MVQREIQEAKIAKNKKPQKYIIFVKIMLVTLWGLFLLLNTWTESIEKLMYLHTFGFNWVPNPDYLSFFYFNDFTLFHPEFIKVKFGHFIGFAILDFLLFNLFKSHKISIILAILFAIFTEFLQLFFGRDGRLYDLLIDSLGIITVFLIFTNTNFKVNRKNNDWH
ncbi:VanZ family protein [Neobacillus sp. MM2021_6]|uniref:VanZ family protein n=1 Tax=Bacillaceae TaxID=186817 RepID=UPI0014098FE1|nr:MULTISPECIES: VanZ family protein [Bacillaceae]MBO0962190.1 VanZ family protein [Neobacillus sp. MM2021_6]NHC19030.1 VanZ family protein [Bacillus sp. MM2020_4]